MLYIGCYTGVVMQLSKFKTYFFYLTVFITGAIILIIEIVGSRILAPFYGSTIYVWSSLITSALAALAMGYYLGGKLADKRPDINIMYFIVGLAGILILLIPFYSNPILIWTDVLGTRFGPLAASAALFTPSLFLLGMVSPFAVKLATSKLENVGFRAGSLYALATLGSLFGVLLAGFYLAPNFALNSIINSSAITLILIYLVWKIIR